MEGSFSEILENLRKQRDHYKRMARENGRAHCYDEANRTNERSIAFDQAICIVMEGKDKHDADYELSLATPYTSSDVSRYVKAYKAYARNFKQQ